MFSRTNLVITGAISLAVTIYLVTWSPDCIASMASSTETSNDALSKLKVSLQQISSDPQTIQATISNEDGNSPMTVLAWDNILDQSALNLGIFKLRDAQTGSIEDMPSLMINRRLPPPREDLVEIQPHSKVTREIVLQSRLLPTDGKTYKFKANGSWKAVWPRSAAEVKDDELAAMSGPGVLGGHFESNEVEVTLG